MERVVLKLAPKLKYEKAGPKQLIHGNERLKLRENRHYWSVKQSIKSIADY